MRHIFLMLFVVSVADAAFAQIYKNPEATVDDRVNDLLSRMTIEEKFWQMFMLVEDWQMDKSQYTDGAFGFEGGVAAGNNGIANQGIQNITTSNAIEMAEIINKAQKFFIENTRLGIPIIPFDEALHGLVRPGATTFPQSIALAATFDTALMHKTAAAIAIETKSRGIRQVLSPVINIAGDVRWGRVEETYGEDPFLTSEMAVAFISEFEKRNVIATPKHFVSNYGDGGRDSYPIHYNERYLREIELPPFKEAFKRGGARSVMTSYNSIDGSPCSANDWLLNTLLKKEWGFKGFVISDAGATGGANVLHNTTASYRESAKNAVNNGLDVIFQTAYEHFPLFIDAFKSGDIPLQVIDSAVARVLKAKFELGLFDKPYCDPSEAGCINNMAEHREIALEAAKKSIVLLKNDNSVLPIKKSVKSIAVTGYYADKPRLGGYSGPGNDVVTILDGIKKNAEPGIKIYHSTGSSPEIISHQIVAAEYLTNSNGESGLTGTYYANIDFSGNPAFVRNDPQINFQWTLFSPDPQKLGSGFYSVIWQGHIKAPSTGSYNIGIDGNDGYRLFIDGKLLIDNRTYRGRNTITKPFSFEEGKQYDLRIEYAEPNGNAWFKLIWNYGVENHYEKELADAVELAMKSDVVIVVAGIEEGEFRDRAILSLPGNQEDLIIRMSATGKPVVVVLTGGSAITMNSWLTKVDGILEVWYPGEAGGKAVAEVLFGNYNPAGRLPITFPVHEGQLPLVYNHKPTGRGDDYFNLTGQPLFPFGFGLSYTAFKYSKLKLIENKAEKVFTVSFNISNTGQMKGDEVVQLYIRDVLSSVARPVKELKGFCRISLMPGEMKEVTFSITPEMLQILDKNLRSVIEPGNFEILIGASSKDIRLKGTLNVE